MESMVLESEVIGQMPASTKGSADANGGFDIAKVKAGTGDEIDAQGT